jgi:hypothetical protein
LENHIATPKDFREAAEASAFGPEERVVLPASGLPVILRRPRARAFVLGRASLPQSLAARLAAPDEPSAPDPEKVAAAIAFWHWMFERIFVRPRLSLHPTPAEIHPDWILPEDQEFLLRWAVGEVGSDGADLAAFRPGASRGPSDLRVDGETLRRDAEPAAGAEDGPLSDGSGLRRSGLAS